MSIRSAMCDVKSVSWKISVKSITVHSFKVVVSLILHVLVVGFR